MSRTKRAFLSVAAIVGVVALVSCAAPASERSANAGASTSTAHPAFSANEQSEETVTTFDGTEIPREYLEEALAPIYDTADPSEFEFGENVALSDEEAGDRFLAISENYELGEPLSPQDLELVRAYASKAEPTGEEVALVADTETVSPASYSRSQPSNITPAGINWFTGNGSQGFSATKSAQGVSAKLTGTLYVNTKWNGIGNSWRIKSAGAIAAGRANVKKNSVSTTFNAYGAVGAWPYVGLIYTQTASASNGTSNVSMDKSYSYSGLLTNWTATPSQTVATKSGSFRYTP